MIENEKGEARAVLKNDISSPHLSVGVRVPCMGAGNNGRERNREPNCERNCESNRRYDNGNEHYGNYRYHRYYRYHW